VKHRLMTIAATIAPPLFVLFAFTSNVADATSVLQTSALDKTSLRTYLSDYGVICDGATDNAKAIATAIAAKPGTAMIWPKGHCQWSGTIALKGSGTEWIGQGAMVTYLEPTSIEGDEVFVGDDANPGSKVSTYNYIFRDFTIFPKNKKISGYTFHIKNAVSILFQNVETNNDLLYAYGGGNRHYNGIYADHSGALHLENVQVRAQQDGLKLTDSIDTLLHFTNLRFSTNALHFTGGVGGFTCIQSTMSESTHNFYVDNTDDPTAANKGATFGEGCFFDTSKSDNIVIDTPLGGLNQYQWVGSSIATQSGDAVHVVAAPNSSILIFTNTLIGSTVSGRYSGIRTDDPAAQIVINGHTIITSNTAYGIEQTYPRAYPNPVQISNDVLWNLGRVRGNQIANTNFPYDKTFTVVGTSTNGATASMTIDGTGKASPTNMIWLADNSAMTYDIQLNCRSTTTADYAYWHLGGFATRGAGPGSFAIRYTTDNGGSGSHKQISATSIGQTWTLGIGDDTANGGVNFAIAGSPGLAVNCTARVTTTEN